MDDALKVSKNIPPDVTAREAAESFIRWVFHEPLDEDDKTILQIVLR